MMKPTVTFLLIAASLFAQEAKKRDVLAPENAVTAPATEPKKIGTPENAATSPYVMGSTLGALESDLVAGAPKKPTLAPDDKVNILKMTVALLQLQQQLQQAAAEYQRVTAAALEKAGAKGCQLTADAEIVCPGGEKPKL